MTDKPRKFAENALNSLGNTVLQRVVIAFCGLASSLILAMGGFVIATGQNMVDSVVENRLRESKPVKELVTRVDSLETKVVGVENKVDTVDKKVETVGKKIDALIGILVEADPKVKAAARKRMQKNQDEKEVQESLTGVKQ